jgi:hypothetical protein
MNRRAYLEGYMTKQAGANIGAINKNMDDQRAMATTSAAAEASGGLVPLDIAMQDPVLGPKVSQSHREDVNYYHSPGEAINGLSGVDAKEKWYEGYKRLKTLNPDSRLYMQQYKELADLHTTVVRDQKQEELNQQNKRKVYNAGMDRKMSSGVEAHPERETANNRYAANQMPKAAPVAKVGETMNAGEGAPTSTNIMLKSDPKRVTGKGKEADILKQIAASNANRKPFASGDKIVARGDSTVKPPVQVASK